MAEKEYIEREAALDIAVEWCPDDDGSVGKTGDLREMLDELEAIPAADVVEVRHGRWEERIVDDDKLDKYGLFRRRFYCSACGDWNTHGASKYCPHCGARMDGGADK